MLQKIHFPLPEDSLEYLKSPIASPWILVMLMLGILYERFNNLYYSSAVAIYALLTGFLALWFKLPRWFFYVIVILLLARHIHIYGLNFSKISVDVDSTRDEAVEVATQTLLQGKNPWSVSVGPPGFPVPISTGPASILFAIPVIMLFGEINWLTFFVWLVFFGILLIGDIITKNSTFPLLALLFIEGIFFTEVTMHMSLEELYYPFIFFPLSYWLVNRKQYFLAGAVLFIPALFRLVYIPAILGFLLWCAINKQLTRRQFLKMGLGAIIITLTILLPFVIIGREEFINNNFLVFALYLSHSSGWLDNNFIFHALNSISQTVGTEIMVLIKLLITTLLLGLISLRLRNLTHPFWHITAGAFIALTITWSPAYSPVDYALFAILPAFIAIAFTPSPFPHQAKDLRRF